LDIKDLSWDEREKILRLLFAKVNNQSQQSYFYDLPDHSFSAAAGHSIKPLGTTTAAGPAKVV
jgi:hypothetical protein